MKTPGTTVADSSIPRLTSTTASRLMTAGARLIHRARPRPARVAARATGPAGRGKRRRTGPPACVDGKHRQEFLQVGALTGRTGRRLPFPGEMFELAAAAAALVFVERHGDTLLERAHRSGR